MSPEKSLGEVVAGSGSALARDQLAELRKDAERYRWLRNNPQWLGWEHYFRPDEVDREVDAAMWYALAVKQRISSNHCIWAFRSCWYPRPVRRSIPQARWHGPSSPIWI